MSKGLLIRANEIGEILSCSRSSLYKFLNTHNSFPLRISRGYWKRKEVMDWFKDNGYA